MEWVRAGQVLPLGAEGEPDSHGASDSWVVEDEDGSLRMWYVGNDGVTRRILSATKGQEASWHRDGVAVDVGFAGSTDAYGLESPSVVRTPGGYLMAYAGFDGQVTRLHMATSDDGVRWTAHGEFMQPGEEDALAATDPCLLVTADRWWLFFTGRDGARVGRRAVVLAATSESGASWDRLGPVLEPELGELAVTGPCVLAVGGGYRMFFVSDDGERTRLMLATSDDALDWNRRGATLAPSDDRAEASLDAPCVIRRHDGSLQLWYTLTGTAASGTLPCICAARFSSTSTG